MFCDEVDESVCSVTGAYQYLRKDLALGGLASRSVCRVYNRWAMINKRARSLYIVTREKLSRDLYTVKQRDS
jgi:hypothetical protein